MINYKKNLQCWAIYATTHNSDWPIIQDDLTKEQLLEMLNILAGYFGATKKGKELLKSWL